MEDLRPSHGTVRFGAFEVDLHARELRKQGIKLKLQEQPFEILQVLLQRPGGIVTREELRQKIWHSDTLSISITACITPSSACAKLWAMRLRRHATSKPFRIAGIASSEKSNPMARASARWPFWD
jgi:Transcriptional regulatory protein, C terminal